MTAPYYSDEQVTLYHGDCREITEWLATDVLVTDPPYGMNFRSFRRNIGGHRPESPGDNDTALRDSVLILWGTRPALVFGTWKQHRPSTTRQLIVWDKRGGAGFSGDLNMPWADSTEEIYVLGNGWSGVRRPAIYSVPTLPSQANYRPDHPTPKPLRLLEELLQVCPSGVIADPFAGSGSTLIAARNLGRQAIGVEIEERYCEIAARRLAQGVMIA